MINDYSAYIQILAAIYTSFGFEKLGDTYFSSKKFQSKLPAIIDSLSTFDISGANNDKITKLFNDLIANFARTSKRCGFIMLAICCIVILAGVILKNSCFQILSCEGIVCAIVLSIPLLYLLWRGNNRSVKYPNRVARIIHEHSGAYNKDLFCVMSKTYSLCSKKYSDLLIKRLDGQSQDPVNDVAVDLVLNDYRQVMLDSIFNSIDSDRWLNRVGRTL